MAVQQKMVFAGVPLNAAYVRIQDGSITGGKRGWRCVMEAFATAAEAEMVEQVRTAADVPQHARYDPTSGVQLTDAELEQVAAAYPKVKVRRGKPYDTFDFPGSIAARNGASLVPWVEGEDPYETLYRAYMAADKSAKAV